MQKLWQLLSLKAKLFSIFFGLSALTTLILAYSLYNQIRTDYYDLLRQELITLASISSSQIDGDRLDSLLTPGQETSAEYINIRNQLMTISAKSSTIKYIYTLRQSDNPRYLTFIVDADPNADEAAHIGEGYDITLAPDMANAFTAPTADQQPNEDNWGSTLSGYAPVYNSHGQVVSIVGVDVATDTILTELDEYKRQTFRYTILALVIAALASLLLASGFSKRLLCLTNAVEQLACGNLNVTVAVDGSDEMARLADLLNHLAATLSSEREKMLLATIKGLINALEAKDSYTYGHSSEVATLTLDICSRLNLPEAETFTIHFAAILHDIGKIGIPDNVLNKEGPLTEEEWLLVKNHPSIGARIIADIPHLNEVAEIVLHHHSRWNGHGYPEPLKGTDIPLGARIITVADSYQAMVSDRSYRRGMPEAKALAEIRRCAGTQFDPVVVDAFLETRHQNKSKITFE